MSNNPANLVTIQDSENHDPLDVSQVPNCVLLDSNQGAKDSSQDSKCAELDGHVCGLSPTANCGHTNNGLIALGQPNPNYTPIMGNISQSICFSNGSNEDNSPPSDTTTGNDPLLPSVINDISSIPRNKSHHSSSKSSPSNGHGVAVTNIAATNVPAHCDNVDDDISAVDNQL